ncbi:MAG TPA: Ig-like domain-containing protein, partial [Patescibacteria group bacterium]|nr:Ig-like domain-containing protein [Patescibacteria group bacterium]
CPDDAACDKLRNSFGNTPGACSAAPYQFDHTYVCTAKELNAMPECTGPSSAASNAPCYRMIVGSPVCVYRPKVQIVDNWGWCNCTGTGCRVLAGSGKGGGAYSSESGAFNGCDLANPPADAKPWTEYAGEIRLAPTYRDAQDFTPSTGGGGGGGGSGSGGTAVNDNFVTSAGILYSTTNDKTLLFNDTVTGPATSRQVTMVDPPVHGTMGGICDPRGCFTITPEGAINYAAASGYHGTDSFTYKIVQGGVDSNVATVTLTIP